MFLNYFRKNSLVRVSIAFFIIIFIFILFSGGDKKPAVNQESYVATEIKKDICDDIDLVRSQAQPINFKELEKSPNSFLERMTIFKGEVLQIQENNSIGAIRLAVTKDTYGWSSSDVVYVEYWKDTNILEGDVINVYGPLKTAKTYTSNANYKITVPRIRACIIEKDEMKKTLTNTTSNTINKPVVISTPTPLPKNSKIPLSVSCVASESPVDINQKVTWTAKVGGGDGSYSYIWSGSDNITGNNSSVDVNYSNSGVKNASIKVTSGDQTLTQPCINTVMVASPKTWHTAFTYSGDTSVKTLPFNVSGTKWKITYSCSTDRKGYLFGGMKSTSGSDYESFASNVVCPVSNSVSYAYDKKPGEYYLDMGPINATYSVLIEDYY